jgi:hypothetical protein
MIQTNSTGLFVQKPGILKSQKAISAPKTLSKYNLPSDTVSFSSVSLFKSKSIIEKAISIIKREPTMGQLAQQTLKVAAQIAAIISSVVAVVLLL